MLVVIFTLLALAGAAGAACAHAELVCMQATGAARSERGATMAAAAVALRSEHRTRGARANTRVRNDMAEGLRERRREKRLQRTTDRRRAQASASGDSVASE